MTGTASSSPLWGIVPLRKTRGDVCRGGDGGGGGGTGGGSDGGGGSCAGEG